MQSANVLLARQPIYDKALNVMGYELLFRPPQGNAWEWDGDVATSQLVVNAFTEIGIEQTTDNKQAFINFTQRWILLPPPFNPAQITIEILESVEPDPEVVNMVRILAQRGFTIALDDFTFHPKWHPLLQLADVVKIDVLQHEGESLLQQLDYLKPYKVKLLAEKVETYEVLDSCKKLGFEYFQGYFLCRPQNIEGDTLPPNKLVVLQLLAQLQDPDVDINSLEKLITKDLALSTKLLRICNSAAYGSRGKIDSIRKATLMIGLNALRQWSSIIALSHMSDKPSELLVIILTRAHMMEQLAQHAKRIDTDLFFTVGLFSLIDACFDQPKAKVLSGLPFRSEINDALLYYQGTAGKILQTVEANERGDWENIDWGMLENLGIDGENFKQAYLNALQYSSAIMQSLKN